MSSTLGTFYFRNEGTGCISGRYFNEGMNGPLPECAKLISAEYDCPFAGKYTTTWLETATEHEIAGLTIKCVGGHYELRWYRQDGTAVFRGIGILVDGLLAGSYKTAI